MSREDLSEIAKDIGNKIIFLYDNISTLINEQRSMNLLLQTEMSNVNKENANLKCEIKNVAMQIKKIETFLGVDADPKFDSFLSQNIFK
jgi:hypothetical protein